MSLFMRPLARHLTLAGVLSFTLACPPRQGAGPGPTAPVDERPKVEVKADPAADDALKKALAVAQPKKKVEALFAVRRAYPDSTAGQDALYQAGVLAFEQGDYVNSRKALNELLFENPLYENALDARFKSGLAALEMKAYRDAYQALSSLVDKLSGPDKQRALDALAKAAAHSQQYVDALKIALKAVEDATGESERQGALAVLEETVEGKASFLSIAQVWQDMSHSHPAWPMLTFKLARIYYHLRDWPRVDERLKALLAEAPASAYAPQAQAMLARAQKRDQTRPMVVGAVLPLTGKYKALGDAVQRGIQLALKTSNVELVVKDSQGDVNLAGKMVEELVYEHQAIAIIGPLLGDDSKRAALVAEELQIPIITLTRVEGITAIGPHVFRNMLTNAQQAQALADYAVNTLGYKTFGVLYPSLPFGEEMTDKFWDEIEQLGGEMRGAESYDHDQTTFTAEAKKLAGRYYLEDRHDYIEKMRDIRDNADMDAFRKRKALEKIRSQLDPVVDFEALLIPDSWQRVGLVAPALAVEDIITNACDRRDLEKILKTTGKKDIRDIKTVTLLGPSTWSSPKGRSGDPELIERGGKFVLCATYVDGFYEGSTRKATRRFVDAYKEAFKDLQPTLLEAVGYDTAGILRELVEKQAPRSREDMMLKLATLKDYDGATGLTSFDGNREARKPLFFLSIQPKGIKEIDVKPRPPGS